ncbi:MAG: DUF790 family protein [Deltaproteobacteria bacterium]|nr:DUF790 family protein [Deltaproteobacteria bacterium]
MLPLALVRARAKGDVLTPRWIDAADPALREVADELVARFTSAARERRTRGELEEELADLTEVLTDKKLFDGLVKLCADRIEAVADPEVDPATLRDEVFRLARARGPIAYERGPLEKTVAADILALVAEQRGLAPDRVASLLYADLREAHTITGFDLPDGQRLLERYNLALAQGLLLAATQLRIRLARPTPGRIRQLLRQARFHQLTHHARRDGDDLLVELDGPVSLFQQSTRYGFQLAAFLPALLLQDGPWSLEADLLWTPQRLRRRFFLDPSAGLVTGRPDHGAHQTREETWFEERFAATTTDWKLAAASEPIELGGQGFAVPAFTLTKGRRVAHLEILGFWRPEALAKRLELLRRFGRGNIILAVSRKMCTEEMDAIEGAEIVPFAQVVPVKDVLAAAERVAR